jgi:hypothetical protein
MKFGLKLYLNIPIMGLLFSYLGMISGYANYFFTLDSLIL